MLCPQNNNNDFDDLTCRDCKWYMQCFKMWQEGNIFSKEESAGDSSPVPSVNDILKQWHKEHDNPITKEEIDKFRIELNDFDLFVDNKNCIVFRRKK